MRLLSYFAIFSGCILFCYSFAWFDFVLSFVLWAGGVLVWVRSRSFVYGDPRQ